MRVVAITGASAGIGRATALRLAAIDRPVPEVFPHVKSRAVVWANTFAPGFTDRVVKRFGRRPVR